LNSKDTEDNFRRFVLWTSLEIVTFTDSEDLPFPREHSKLEHENLTGGLGASTMRNYFFNTKELHNVRILMPEENISRFPTGPEELFKLIFW